MHSLSFLLLEYLGVEIIWAHPVSFGILHGMHEFHKLRIVPMSKHNFRKRVANLQAICSRSKVDVCEVEEPLRLLRRLVILLFAGIDEKIPIFNDHVAVRSKTAEIVAPDELLFINCCFSGEVAVRFGHIVFIITVC